MEIQKSSSSRKRAPSFEPSPCSRVSSSVESSFLNWWEKWSTALIEHMTTEKNLSIADQAVCRWIAIEFCDYLTSECAEHWFHWTFDRSCNVTDLTFVRWRWHAIWSLQQWGLPKDICREVVSQTELWSSQEAYRRGAKMMRRLFYWEGMGEEKRLKWLF